ncbi:MAG TPA: GNAT family N-acetyltransferase [Vitreimonas sp.]|uniref:GNAT family N-acetyltransferase n=1 Tax=Vitreimonas sp. TaxID=3069702 RepID=UPI002D40BC12|nr:GNAT family N-acetyltransferase [Vitreimonas sp.]HYD89280.1 GNAT family N-acetyltransferase [Vitreimonas sp.]
MRVDIVRRIDELLEVWSVRSLVYMAEQNCPYEEEFDGNDLAAATHLIARLGKEPVATMRIRWFAAFAKIERVAVRPGHRSGEISAALVKAALEHAARKGYTKVIGHVQKRLLRYWRRAADVRVREGRPEFRFSAYDYVEIEKDLAPRADAIGLDTPAMIVLRPEGAWDRPGVLERSAKRGGSTKGPVR